MRWRNLTVRWYVFSSSDWNSSDRTKVVTNIKTTFSSYSLLEDGLRKPGSRVYIIQNLPDKIDHPKAKLRYVFFTSWYDGSFQSPDDSSFYNHWLGVNSYLVSVCTECSPQFHSVIKIKLETETDTELSSSNKVNMHSNKTFHCHSQLFNWDFYKIEEYKSKEDSKIYLSVKVWGHFLHFSLDKTFGIKNVLNVK